MMDKLFRATYRKTWFADDLLVRRPGRMWPVLVSGIVLLVLGWVCTVIISVCPPGPLRATASGVIGAYIALVGMAYLKRLRAYKYGWIEGRSAMIQALVEAGKRGMSISDWLQAQAEKDMALMGIKPPEPPQWTEDDL
jgi:hypothetical protein